MNLRSDEVPNSWREGTTEGDKEISKVRQVSTLTKDALKLHLHLGDLGLTIEEYADLTPGLKLQFDRPSLWEVSLKMGAVPVARGHLEISATECILHIDSIISEEVDRKL